jgi:hypothetical protein
MVFGPDRQTRERKTREKVINDAESGTQGPSRFTKSLAINAAIWLPS